MNAMLGEVVDGDQLTLTIWWSGVGGSEQENEALWVAAESGDVEGVKAAFCPGADVNRDISSAKLGWTPLHLAALNGHVEVAKFLFQHGANCNPKDYEGSTPLHLAALNGHVEAADFLVKHGADPNPKDDQGSTPLHLAAMSGRMEVTQVLAVTRADINAKESWGWTPLHLASRHGHVDVAKVLTDNGADVNAKDKLVGTSCRYASLIQGAWSRWFTSRTRHCHTSHRTTCVEGDLITRYPCTDEPQTARHNVSRLPFSCSESLTRDRYLLERGLKLDLAAWNGHVKIAQFLVAIDGADINAKDTEGWTPLHRAAVNGQVEMVNVLVHGADLNAADKQGRTPLHWASRHGHLEVVKVLKAKADLNAQDKQGWTLLQEAADNGHVEVLEALLNASANVDVKNHSVGQQVMC